MSGTGSDELSDDEEPKFEDDEEYTCEDSSEEDAALSAEDRLFAAVANNDADAAAAVQQAIRDGANVNAVRFYSPHLFGNDKTKTPLFDACKHGSDRIVSILLDAGADARWRNCEGRSAISEACLFGHLSTVQLLINHDNRLVEIASSVGFTSLFNAVIRGHVDVVRVLLDGGADAHHVDRSGRTALMHACEHNSLEIVRQLLAAGVDVEARDEKQLTALHLAARIGWIEVVRELILLHNTNMCTVDEDGRTPFDLAWDWALGRTAVNPLLEIYGNKLTQDHGRLALHELLKVAKYSFAEEGIFPAWSFGARFYPPLNPLRIRLPLGKLTLTHLRTPLHMLDPELIRNRDDTGKLPLHIACQTNAPVEVLALISELDPAVLHIADSTGALPIHLFCGTTAATEYASVRYLVEQGGVGTLTARNMEGAMPLHVLCESTDPPLRAVQYLIQSFPGSVAVQTNAGQYPFMMAAACDSCSVSLSVVYELVRANPGLVMPR